MRLDVWVSLYPRAFQGGKRTSHITDEFCSPRSHLLELLQDTVSTEKRNNSNFPILPPDACFWSSIVEWPSIKKKDSILYAFFQNSLSSCWQKMNQTKDFIRKGGNEHENNGRKPQSGITYIEERGRKKCLYKRGRKSKCNCIETTLIVSAL